MNGKYLVCPTEDEHDPLIYLLIKIDGDICGICVNREFVPSTASWGKEPLLKVGRILKWYETLGYVRNHRKSRLPILDGGESKKGLFVLHNAFSAAKQTQPTSKMYCVSLLDDFFEGAGKQAAPILFQFVNGYRIFDQISLDQNISAGTWKLRNGLHAMAYGTNLPNKARHIDLLSEEKPSEIKIGGFDMGSFMNETMKLFGEFQPSLMHSGVAGYLRKIDPDSPYETHLKVIRLMIAVAETEGNDVVKVMKKHTHEELVKLYDSAVEGGFNFKLLDEFDQRFAMLEDLGFVPVMYDFITAGIFVPAKKSEAKKPPSSGRLSQLEETIRKVSDAVKAKGASDAKE